MTSSSGHDTRLGIRRFDAPDVVALAAVIAGVLLAGFAVILGLRLSGPESCDATKVAKTTMPSVVTILVRGADGSRGNGAGEFMDTEGHILTNNHVISAAANGGSIQVLRPNGEELTAQLVGRDSPTDLAVIKVAPRTPAQPFTTGPAPAIGDSVFAIGAPLGLSETFTAGVVSSLDRSVQVPADAGTTALLVGAIQTDASINPGNSGGMLADCQGRLVGVPTAGRTAQDSSGNPVGGSIGLGFAIPVDTASRISHSLITTGTVQHSYLGLQALPTASRADATSADGLYITSVTPQGPAEAAGLRPGDVIRQLNGSPVDGAQSLLALSLTQAPGATASVAFERDGVAQTVMVQLSSKP